jgi:hypothetical protein
MNQPEKERKLSCRCNALLNKFWSASVPSSGGAGVGADARAEANPPSYPPCVRFAHQRLRLMGGTLTSALQMSGLI